MCMVIQRHAVYIYFLFSNDYSLLITYCFFLESVNIAHRGNIATDGNPKLGLRPVVDWFTITRQVTYNIEVTAVV